MNDFNTGAGGFITAAGMLLAIQSIGVTIIFLYVSWLCLSAYQDFCNETIRSSDMIFVWARGVFIMMVMIYILIV